MKHWFALTALLLLLLVNTTSGQDYTAAWQPLAVPGAWEDNAKNTLAKYDGYAWFRCWVKVPADWRGTDLALISSKRPSTRSAQDAAPTGIRASISSSSAA